MLRILLIVVLAAAVVAGGGAVLAQDTGDWPGFRPAPEPGSDFRGPGFYLSWIKILVCWIVFLVWIKSTNWVNCDAQEMKMPVHTWNPIVFGPFVAAFVLLWWLIPYFWLGFPLLVVAYVAPFVSYVVYRNRRVQPHERVFTRAHVRYWLSEKVGRVGVKIAAEAPDVHAKGPPVVLKGRGGETAQQDEARTIASRQAPGLRAARQLVADALGSRASAILLDYTQQSAAVRHMIDGVWHNRQAEERQTADPALEALKALCALKPEDRQSRQQGTFAATYAAVEYDGTLASQGTKTGERVLIQFTDKRVRFDTLDELGMRPKLQAQLKEFLGLKQGFLLFSAMPASGLRSTMKVVLHQMDRLTREFAAVEEETNRYEEIENIPVTTYRAADGQSPAAVLPKLFRLDPNVVVIRDLVDAETVGLLCREVSEGRLMISTVRAKDCAEALLRVLALGAPAEEFTRVVAGAVGQRLVRRLCDECKEAYQPTPQVLKQLGIPEGRIEAFYRPPQQPEEVCRKCQGVGYYGRTAVFEFLTVGDTVRRVLGSKPKLELLRSAARKDGMRSLQEEGILLVAKGVTSLPELMRVLKQ